MQCPVCNGEMWDNTVNKKNPKGPDYKCKDQNCAKAVWLEKKTFTPKTNGRNEGQIVRQHSQEMALIYCQAKGKTDFNLKELGILIDWFEADALGKRPEPKQEPAQEQDEVNIEEIPFE